MDDDEKFKLMNFPGPPPSGRIPQEDVIGLIELLLWAAKNGNITSFAYIAALPDSDDPPAVGYSGEQRNAISMGISMLNDEIVWRRRFSQ